MIHNLHHFFPDIFERLDKIEDFRERPQYKLAEIIFAAIAIHIFKATSRNAFNNINQGKFAQNYFQSFGLRLPHMDTVDLIMRVIPEDELEKLKTHLIYGLIEKKLFYKYKILDQFCNVSVDGTGVMTINEANIKNFPNALTKVFNKGKENEKTVYFLNVLEAKLVCANGFCISLVTEWIENPDGEYVKQDCELKAFRRLAEKLKRSFPRLPICIVGDGLYPNKTVFEICKANNWEWIFTFKDDCLRSVWEEVELLKELQAGNSLTVKSKVMEKNNESKIVEREVIKIFSWVESIDYKGHDVHWCKLIETVEGEIKHTFIYLSSLVPAKNNIEELVKNGRLRFKIENEGFNIQKNLGYGLQHKYSQTSALATKNYYTCLQIGHIINQLLELQKVVKELTKGRETITNLWQLLICIFTIQEIQQEELTNYLEIRRQVRFD
ncbi:MAG: hypothetical protein KJN80_04595 [Deltaproteobacteria bacterium]|nr:hypothetical protein [Deltaproteobacteria bacterium]